MNSSKKLERYYPTIVTAVVFVIIGAVASQVLLPREAPLQEGDLISGVLERLDELEAGHDVQKSYIQSNRARAMSNTQNITELTGEGGLDAEIARLERMIESIPAGPEGPPGPEGPTDPRAKWGYKTFRLSDGVTTVTDTQLQRLGDYQLECPVNSWFIVLFSATFRNPSESEIKVQAHIDGTSVLSWEYRVVPKDLETTTLHFTSNTAYAAGSHTLSLYLLNSSSWNTEIYVEKLLITVISIPVS